MNTQSLDKNLKNLKYDWKIVDNKIQIKVEFDDFITAFEFMQEISKECIRINHHPNWTNSYNKLKISLFTHDLQKITDLDFKLAKIIDRKLSKYKV
jgi:4a-hydroxytetrahydrobiopterin dehydratase